MYNNAQQFIVSKNKNMKLLIIFPFHFLFSTKQIPIF